jgi:hypothetical protein
MSKAAPLQTATPKPLQTAGTNLILQRKCACGAGASSLTGECGECSKKKMVGLQMKLRINEPGDMYEQEADRVAEQVLAKPAHPDVSSAPPRIQRYAGQTTGQADTAPASVDHVLASSGRPLDPALRQDMEQRFGHDFSRVRVHSGGAAEQSALEVNANAYTVGSNIVFGAGRFAPGTNEGRRLIAHELAHVVQQSGSAGVLQRPPAAGSKLESGPDPAPGLGAARTKEVGAVTATVSSGEGAPRRAAAVQRDLAAETNAYGADNISIGEALGPLIDAKKVRVTTSGKKTMYSCAVPEERPAIERTLGAQGFKLAKQMTDAIFDPHHVVLFTGGVDPQYGGQTFGGSRRDDGLENQSNRALTAFELGEVSKVFWGSLRTDTIEIEESRIWTLGGYARTTPDHVRFPPGSFGEPGFVPWLIHELTHVWQYQHGAPLGNVIVSAFRGNYDYGGEEALKNRRAEGDSFGDFGFEQQGDILQDYYERLVRGGDVSAYEPYLGEVRAGMWDRLPPVKGIEPLPTGTLDVRALNEKHRGEIEHQIIGQLRLPMGADDPRAITRSHRLLELFRQLTPYWSGTYRERIAARRSDDQLVNLLFSQISRYTRAKIFEILGVEAERRRAPESSTGGVTP